MDCSGFPRLRVGQLRPGSQCHRDDPGPQRRQASPDQRPLRQHPGRTGRVRRRARRGDDAGGRRAVPAIAAGAAGDPAVQRRRGIWPQRRRAPSSAPTRWRNDVNSLINIDARGVSGPALMFETSSPNGAAIAAYSRWHAPALRQFDQHRFRQAHPQHHRRRQIRAAAAGRCSTTGSSATRPAIIRRATTSPRSIGPASRMSAARCCAAARALSAMPDPARAGSGRMVFTDIAGRAFIRLPLGIAAAILALLLLVATVPGVAQKGARQAAAARGGHAVRRKHRRRAGRAWSRDCSAPAISGAPIRSSPTSPSMPCCSRRWRRSGRSAASGFVRERMRAAAWLLILIFGAALSARLARRDHLLPDRAGPRAGRDCAGRSLAASRDIVRDRCDRRSVPDARPASRAGRNAADRRAAVGRCPLAALAALPAIIECDVGPIAACAACACRRGRRALDRRLDHPARQRRAAARLQHRLFPRRQIATAQAGAWRTSRRPARPTSLAVGARACCPTTAARGGSRPPRCSRRRCPRPG